MDLAIHLAPKMHSLSLALTSFIGRESELQECRRLLSRTRVLTLTGPGGCGKSRLAYELATGLAHAFTSGVALVELAEVTAPALVVQAVMAELGIRAQTGRDPLQSLIDALRSRNLLLLLDNCEHLTAACQHLSVQLLTHCPQMSILATSREVLGVPGESDWSIPPLALPPLDRPLTLDELMRYDAARLLLERAALHQHDPWLSEEERAAIARICHRLDGLPLALELAAARMRVLSALDMEERLSDRFQLLANKRQYGQARQQTLQATIDWSYELLMPQERQLWNRLSIFAGSCSIGAVEGICSGGAIAQQDILELITRLVEKSVLYVEQVGDRTRYRMLESIREYGAQRLSAAGERESLQQRYVEWYADHVEETSLKGFDHRHREFYPDIANLRQAVQWAREEGDIESDVRICGAIMGYMRAQGLPIELPPNWREIEGRAGLVAPAVRARLHEAVLLSKESPQYLNMSVCLEGLAEWAAAAGRFERAVQLAGAARNIYEQNQPTLLFDWSGLLTEDLAQARRHLGEDAYARAWEAGQRMRAEDLYAYAMEEEALLGAVPLQQPATEKVEPAHGLTEREMEIVRLVGQGLSQKEIGKQLYISPRTVQAHEDHIRAKLMLPNRASLVAWAVRLG